MSARVTWFFPQPASEEVPPRPVSPFDAGPPHPLAQRAATEVLAHPPATPAGEGGKMLGVLVVRDAQQRLGYLKAFSGTWGGQWEQPGFVPPVFDAAARAALEGPGEAEVKRLWHAAEALERAGEAARLRGELDALERTHAELRAARDARHAQQRQARHRLRAGAPTADVRHRLDEESRRDKRERRQEEAAWTQARAALERAWLRADRRRRALERLRQAVSRRLMQRLFDTYLVSNARGERRRLRALFAPNEPPSGAGDCCAPKLLAAAYAQGLEPLALAEFWSGPSPLGGGRVEGVYYPPCRAKCGPLLPFMLEGLDVAPARGVRRPQVRDGLEVVYEDAWLVVVNKPSGLLSVPGKGADALDSVLTRLRQRHPRAEGPLLVHRLDEDTSGLLLAGLNPHAHRALQRQFLQCEVEKHYVAWVAGQVAGEQGEIQLALRVDLDDRPRQLHDPVHGRPALTHWRVLARTPEATQVELRPRTGRTHQLRVHAAHPLGLGCPIVGDRLYGRAGERLLLHAQRLGFTHPQTGARLTVCAEADF